MLKKINLLKWLDTLSWSNLLIVALLLGIVPISPEPHLVEKIRMLFQGALNKPIDIFDLLLHASPIMLAALKGLRQYRSRAVLK